DGAFWRDADFAQPPGPPLPDLERFDRLPPAAGATRERRAPGCARCRAEEIRVRGLPPPALALDAPARNAAVRMGAGPGPGAPQDCPGQPRGAGRVPGGRTASH